MIAYLKQNLRSSWIGCCGGLQMNKIKATQIIKRTNTTTASHIQISLSLTGPEIQKQHLQLFT